MNFDLSSDQKMLVETAASFAKKSSPVSRQRALRDDDLGYERRVWRQMGELGWLGIPFPEQVGGFGGGFVDAALVIEKLGTTLVPEPYIPAVILAGTAIARAGTDEQMQRWLGPLCEGEITLALAALEAGSRFDVGAVATRAERRGDVYHISGEKTWVQNGHGADVLVVSARTGGDVRARDGVSLFAVDRTAPGLEIRPVKTIDGRRAAAVTLDDVEVAADRRLGAEGSAVDVLEEAFDRGAAAACAEGVGVAQAVLDMTVEYLKTREQFGAKIGTFQALQHRAVEIFVETELCRSAAIGASLTVDAADAEERARAVSAAMVQLCAGGRFVVRQGIQLHGGIGCTDEHDVGLYFKRMQALTTMFGDEHHHTTRFASLPGFAAGIAGGEAEGPPAA